MWAARDYLGNLDAFCSIFCDPKTALKIKGKKSAETSVGIALTSKTSLENEHRNSIESSCP